MTALEKQGAAAKQAARVLACADTEMKNRALGAIARALEEHMEEWLAANRRDCEAAQEAGITKALLDRLMLNEERVRGVAQGVREVEALPDPIGAMDGAVKRPNGLLIAKQRVPLGVIGIIYEARPNVTVDAAALCLKSGNVCILRGGKEAFRSNQAVVSIMRGALREAGLPEDCISLVQDTSRESANELMHLNEYLDVLIPRGGAGLIRSVSQNASVPVIRTGEGVCHVYADEGADLDMAAKILQNAKCSRPSVCNACECALLHESLVKDLLKKAVPLLDEYGTKLRCDEASLAALRELGLAEGRAQAAVPEDWDTEFGDFILAVKTVKNIDEALDFIAAHGTGHSECIVTKDYFRAQRFLNEVDAAAVYVNASTRFTDGGVFGLGAEIGISTQKLHTRGPMGLQELTSIKYLVYGEGQVR